MKFYTSIFKASTETLMPSKTRTHRGQRRRRWVRADFGRSFAKINQWHSCEVRGIDTHFAGKKAPMRVLFDALIEKLRQTGLLRIDAVKSSINLVSKHHLAGIRVRVGYLRVGFLATRAIRNRRIVDTLVLGPNRIAHSVIIRSDDDIDREFLEWLTTAQTLQS